MKDQTINIEFTNQELDNLMVFLDRIEYKGFTEVQAINQIVAAINKAKQDNQTFEIK